MGVVPKQVCHFSSLSIFAEDAKAISRRAARRLIALYPKQNVESEKNGKLVRFCASICIKLQQQKNAVRQVKGYTVNAAMRAIDCFG